MVDLTVCRQYLWYSDEGVGLLTFRFCSSGPRCWSRAQGATILHAE
jgi:hypothetical protein